MDFWSVVTGINGSFSLLLSNTSSFIFEIFRSKKCSLNYEFRRSNWRKYSARQFLSWRHATKAMSSANFTRVSKALVDTTSLVYTENKIGKRTHPCGAPVFTISSSDLVPLRLALCGRSHRSCLIQRTRVWLAPRSKSLLIRKWGWIVLKADEKSMKMIQTYQDGLQLDLWESDIHLQHPFWPCGQTVEGPCVRPQKQPTGYTLSSPYTSPEQTSKPQAWNHSSVLHWVSLELVLWLSSSTCMEQTCYPGTTETDRQTLVPSAVCTPWVLYP